MKYTFYLLIVSILSLSFGCVKPKPVHKMTTLELRALQTREYHIKDQNIIMNALISTLQDDRYIIKKAKSKLGLVIAGKVSYGAEITANMNITKKGDTFVVRATFRRGSYQILKTKFYQEFFIKLNKALFLEKEGI